MIGSLFRILIGFVMACLTAGLTQVLFVITPAELIGLDMPGLAGKLGKVGLWSLLAATQIAIFSAGFALIAIAFAEWQGIRLWVYYAAAGIAIAVTGFLVQYTGEGLTRAIINDYALWSFLAAGLIAGWVYWAAAGCKACRCQATAPQESA